MKKVNKLFIGFFVSLSIIIVLSGCVKNDFDLPPASSVPYDANKILTLAQVKQIYADNGGEYKFNDIYSVYAVVVMDDATGNIYKSAYVQDSNDGIDLYLNSSGLVQGDSIRIMLKGAMVSVYHGLMQIQDLHVDSNIVKLQTMVNIEPKLVTISEIKTGDYQSKLIKLNEVQFVQADLGQTYADAVGLQSENRTLETCDKSTIIVRTSGYATFAGEKLPSGKGSIIAIASVYDSVKQLVIRRLSEVQLNGERCAGSVVTSINEDFESQTNYEDISISGWLNIAEVGSRKWQGKEFDENIYAQATSYNSGEDNTCWLITPGIDFDAIDNPVLSFETAQAYWEHDGLTIFISTDFDGSNIGSATWEQINCTIAGQYDPDHEWIPTGDIDLSSYNGIGYIAFRYEGSDLNGQTTSYRIDNVHLNGN